MAGKRTGVASLVRLVTSLCRINALFRDTIRPRLTPSERVLYDALVVACDALMLAFPLTE